MELSLVDAPLYAIANRYPIPEFVAPRRVAVFFATRQGHTRRVANRIGSDLRKHGFDVDLQDVRFPLKSSLGNYVAIVLAASVHTGASHEKEMVRFVREHRTELSLVPTAFISVTLSEAGVENPDTTVYDHARYCADVRKMLNKFFEDTEWFSTYEKPVAGALIYSKYNLLYRWVMKRIAQKAGTGTDTSRDYIYTDWADLDRFIDEFAPEIPC